MQCFRIERLHCVRIFPRNILGALHTAGEKNRADTKTQYTKQNSVVLLILWVFLVVQRLQECGSRWTHGAIINCSWKWV